MRDQRQGWSGAGLVLVAGPVCAALVIAPGWLFYYDVTPRAVIALLAGGSAAALIGDWAGGWSALRGSGPARLFAAALALGAVSSAISTWLSGDPALSWTGSSWRRLGLPVELALTLWGLALAGWAAGSRRRVLFALRSVCLAGLTGAIYGISQYFGVDPFQDGDLYHVGEGVWSIVRPPGTLGHAGYFATFLLHAIFAGATLAGCDDSRIWRRLGAVVTAASTAATIFSGTRSALIGLAAGAAVLLAGLRPRPDLRAAAIAAALSIAAAGFYLSPPGEKLRARTRWALEDVSGGGRHLLWRDAWALGADRWAAGSGLETFSAAFPPYQSLELTRIVPERYYESPHNVLLDAWSSQGLAGLATLAGWLAAAVWAALRARSRLATGLAAGLVAALASNQFLAFTVTTKWFLLLQAALLVALVGGNRAAVVGRRVLFAVGAIVAVASGIAAFQLVRADRRLELVRQEFASGRPAEAVEAYERFLEVRPPGMYADLWFSRELLRAVVSLPPTEARRLAPAALEAGERAARRSETPHVAFYNLAALRAEQGDLDGVEHSLKDAIAAAPRWYPPYYLLARTLEAQGDMAGALPLIVRADELGGAANEEVRAARERLEAAR